MKKRLALGILVVLLLLLLPVALHTFKYQQLRAPVFACAQCALATQKLHLLCEQGINWSNLSLQERCEIRQKASCGLLSSKMCIFTQPLPKQS